MTQSAQEPQMDIRPRHSTRPQRDVRMIPTYTQSADTEYERFLHRLKVCGYARVSTDTDEQQGSYEAQVDHYTRYIQTNPEWSFSEVYTDDGISATSTKNRDGFNRMIEDALAGKIDMIITKSISRFARNTVDSLTTVRKLKEKGIAVFFEKENLNTLDSKGELMITIMSSIAQEESRSISENVKWGQRKRMADGEVNMMYKGFLGYERGEDDQPKIVEKEAAIVRMIYKLFIAGRTPSWIAKHLTRQEIPTPYAKSTWSVSTIKSILSNVKYKGDVLLQRTYTEDYLTKKVKKNNGILPQFYISNNHPPIIEPEIFDLVQHEIKRREDDGNRTSCSSIFAGKIICGECGATYGRKLWHSTDKYRKEVWRCNRKYGIRDVKGTSTCTAPIISQVQVEEAVVAQFNALMRDKGRVVAELTGLVDKLMDGTELDRQIAELEAEAEKFNGQLRALIQENASRVMDQGDYQRRRGVAVQGEDEARDRLRTLVMEKKARRGRRDRIAAFLKVIEGRGIIDHFDERLWSEAVERVLVGSDGRLVVGWRGM